MTGPRPTIRIGDRAIAQGEPVFVIAELSANHSGSLERALELVDLAAGAGVDAVKFQTYRPDTMTLDADSQPFVVGEGSLWSGRRLYDLYSEAQTPWAWHEQLFGRVREHGLIPLSTPFDATAVDFLVSIGSTCLKVASFELTDRELVERCASTGLPLLVSTGMATVSEIEDAMEWIRASGTSPVVLLRCNSGYPAAPEEMDLATIPDMIERWGVPVGLSDHTLSTTAAIAAAVLGASVVEKHITLSRSEPGPDSAFSIEPAELRSLVVALRETTAAVGSVRYGPSRSEHGSLAFRRSIWATDDVPEGALLTRDNVAVLRPAGGLVPALLPEVLGRRAARPIRRATAITWDDVGGAPAAP